MNENCRIYVGRLVAQGVVDILDELKRKVVVRAGVDSRVETADDALLSDLRDGVDVGIVGELWRRGMSELEERGNADSSAGDEEGSGTATKGENQGERDRGRDSLQPGWRCGGSDRRRLYQCRSGWIQQQP